MGWCWWCPTSILWKVYKLLFTNILLLFTSYYGIQTLINIFNSDLLRYFTMTSHLFDIYCSPGRESCIIWAQFFQTRLGPFVSETQSFLKPKQPVLVSKKPDPNSAQWRNFTSRRLSCSPVRHFDWGIGSELVASSDQLPQVTSCLVHRAWPASLLESRTEFNMFNVSLSLTGAEKVQKLSHADDFKIAVRWKNFFIGMENYQKK